MYQRTRCVAKWCPQCALSAVFAVGAEYSSSGVRGVTSPTRQPSFKSKGACLYFVSPRCRLSVTDGGAYRRYCAAGTTVLAN
eukprot:IDg21009t1